MKEPHHLELEDGFADTDGNPNEAMPTTQSIVTFAELPGGATSMLIETRFPSTAAMDQMIEMGMDAGLSAAMGQIEAILAAD